MDKSGLTCIRVKDAGVISGIFFISFNIFSIKKAASKKIDTALEPENQLSLLVE